MGGRKPGKIVPMLSRIIEMLESHKVVTLHLARNTFNTNRRLDELKKLSENTQAALTKALAEEEAKKSVSKFRKVLDRAGDTTLLKGVRVGMAYHAVLVGGSFWLYGKMDSDPQGAKFIEDVKNKWQFVTGESKKKWERFRE